MNERSGLLTLADRLERLIHGNLVITSKTHRGAIPEPGDAPVTQSAERASIAVLAATEPKALETGRPEVRMALPPNPKTLRVLIAESDELEREVLAHLVENAGYGSDCVDSAEAALAAVQNRDYVLLLLDCDSREIRGLETAAAVRLLSGAAGKTPIVAITGSGGEDQRRQRKGAGIDNYLSKPILRENVETVLARYAPVENSEPFSRYLALDRHRLLELEGAAKGRPELLCRWIQMFLSRAPEHLDRMRSAQEDRNIARLSEAARQLRILSGQIGALRVQETCGIIAALCSTGSFAGAEALVPETALALDRAVRELHILEADVHAGRGLSGRPAAGTNSAAPRSNEILIVEDDSLIARFLANSLSGAGFSVTHVAGGRAALDALLERQWGAVVLNLDVSEVDGFSVLSEIRLSPQREVPVIIVSSRRQEQDIVRAFELGADDYVTIPFNPSEVVVRLRRLFRHGAVPS